MRNDWNQILTPPLATVELSHREVLDAVAAAALRKAGFPDGVRNGWADIDVVGPERVSRDVAAWRFPLLVDLHDGRSIAIIRCSKWQEQRAESRELRAEDSERNRLFRVLKP